MPTRIETRNYSLQCLTACAILLSAACSDGSSTGEPSSLSLRELADQRGILIGAAVRTQSMEEDVQYMDILGAEFNSVTSESHMKWKSTEPQHKAYTWDNADSLMAFATAYGQAVRGHTLVWPNEYQYNNIPDYVRTAPDAQTMQSYIDDHIEAVVGRYADTVDRWDVVNEAMRTLGARLDENVITTTLGENWIVRAFKQTRQLDPTAKLYLNTVLAERPGAKHQALLALVKRLINAGAPIDGIGLQSHFLGGAPHIEELIEVMEDWEALGMEVAITELDIPVRGSGGEETQAQSYWTVVTACLSVSACREVTFWGFTDKHSWLNGFLGPDSRPLLFDDNYQPKPPYFAVVAALKGQEY